MRTPSVCILLLFAVTALAQTDPATPTDYRELSDLKYAYFGENFLALDLYLPEVAEPAPLVVFVHGGAWRGGSKRNMPMRALVAEGFAVASIDYRLSRTAPFPAQAHDIKRAIRFLRGQQKRYGYDARRIAITGASAGGHLAALVGVTNGDEELEGQVGDHLDQSSAVQAIVSYFGASNLTTILDQSTPHGLSIRVSALELLLDGSAAERQDLARIASPVFHVDESDPPLLLLHGDQDPQMPVNQSLELFGAYQAMGLPVRLEIVHGAGHGGKEFFDEARTRSVATFLREHLLAR